MYDALKEIIASSYINNVYLNAHFNLNVPLDLGLYTWNFSFIIMWFWKILQKLKKVNFQVLNCMFFISVDYTDKSFLQLMLMYWVI